METYMVGHFKGENSGSCMMFIYKDNPSVLRIKLAYETIYVNSRNPLEVQKWYQELGNNYY